MKRWFALVMVAMALLMGACAEEGPLFPTTGSTPGASPSPSGPNGGIGGTVG